MKSPIYLLLAFMAFSCQSSTKPEIEIVGELKQWHKVTLEIVGPETSEYAKENPFLDYALEVIFTNGSKSYRVPGYFAADGNAGETSASEGKIWKVHFRPDATGSWRYLVSFKRGKNIAVVDGNDQGDPVGSDGQEGTFEIKRSDKTGSDFRARGRIVNGGEGYFKFQDTDKIWLKNGADSPENFLAYDDFDQTSRFSLQSEVREGEADPQQSLHRYESHINDWREGDPSWKNGKGKGLIGALNYLQSAGVNSVYMLTMNIIGDGKDVWPYTDYNVVLHTHSDDEKQDAYLTPMLGFESLDGPSLQIGDPAKVHERVKKWIGKSEDAGLRWIVNLDEIGPAWKGVMPDSHDASHDTIREQCLWGALMAGATGVEWYFGYRFLHNDLGLEDFRSRANWWKQSTIATQFLSQFPLEEMQSADELVRSKGAYCLTKPAEIYVVYLPAGTRDPRLHIASDRTFAVKWFNPRTGGVLQEGSVSALSGRGNHSLGTPPADPLKDWVVVVQ